MIRSVRSRSAAIMFISQANPGWDQSDGTEVPLRDPKTLAESDGQPDGFQDFLTALRDQAILFRKPVAYVHGDSHYFVWTRIPRLARSAARELPGRKRRGNREGWS